MSSSISTTATAFARIVAVVLVLSAYLFPAIFGQHQLAIQPSELTVLFGKQAVFHCDAADHWYRIKIGASLRSDIPKDDDHFRANSGRLTISPVGVLDAGTYGCYSAAGKDRVEAELTVVDAIPRCELVGANFNREIVAGEDIRLVCSFKHRGGNLTVQWRDENGKNISAIPRQITVSGQWLLSESEIRIQAEAKRKAQYTANFEELFLDTNGTYDLSPTVIRPLDVRSSSLRSQAVD